jgi:hypothetical protein
MYQLPVSLEDVTDPIGDITRFIANYDEAIGTPHPTFYQGSYSQVSPNYRYDFVEINFVFHLHVVSTKALVHHKGRKENVYNNSNSFHGTCRMHYRDSRSSSKRAG